MRLPAYLAVQMLDGVVGAHVSPVFAREPMWARVSRRPSRTAYTVSFCFMVSSFESTSSALTRRPRPTPWHGCLEHGGDPGPLRLRNLGYDVSVEVGYAALVRRVGDALVIEPTMSASLSHEHPHARRPRDLSHERNSRRHSEDSARPSAASMTLR